MGVDQGAVARRGGGFVALVTAAVVVLWTAVLQGAMVYTVLGVALGALVSLLPWLRRQGRLRAGILDGSAPGDAEEVAQRPWDYVIVGGGTAGCVLANRLTAGTGKRVLVLEAGAGDYDNRRIQIPAGVLDLFQTKYDWHFQTRDAPAGAASGRSVYLCRGRVLGGSSSLNVLLYTRGDARDYDLWEEEFGCAGWSSREVLRYFRRTEDDRTGLAERDSKHHGRGGEWAVDHVRYQNELSARFLRACSQAGLRQNPDFNNWDGPQEGAGRFCVSQRDGARCSGASALLAPALLDQGADGELKVLCGAHALRVEFADRRAQGVRIQVASGKCHTVQLAPGGEVILAGGALHSPQLLMLSGIGPKAHLQEHGLEVLADLPGVGENLQDHPAANVSYECPASKRGISPTSHTMFLFGRKIPHPAWILRWLLLRTGPLTSPGCDHGGFFSTERLPGGAATAEPAAAEAATRSSPDLQLRFLPARAVTADGMNSFAVFRNQKQALPDGFTFQSIAARPCSRGRVRLASSEPLEPPVVEGGYLTDERDVASIRAGLRLSRGLAQQPAFAEFLGREVFPGAEVQDDQQLDAYIAETLHTANALVGTCRMGRRTDPLAVCDPEMRVIGVEGLRVCDASVMPKLPGGQAGAPTVMIAERAADFVLGRAQPEPLG